jgi:hypothetical protein
LNILHDPGMRLATKALLDEIVKIKMQNDIAKSKNMKRKNVSRKGAKLAKEEAGDEGRREMEPGQVVKWFCASDRNRA